MDSKYVVDQNIATLLYESEAVCFLKGIRLLIVKNDLNMTDDEVYTRLLKSLNDTQPDSDNG